ncbi:MAG: hypothetical protein AAF206_15095 [Bacteroidota bacterium]
MTFELIPVLSLMEELYQQPPRPERFQEYINRLRGETKTDLALPIVGFNPMAREHVLGKIAELQAIDAEGIMQSVMEEVNAEKENDSPEKIQVVLNLADDLKGGWTNRYTTDFDTKFKLHAFVVRNFCTPFFWSSEAYTVELICQRTMDQLYRTIWAKRHPRLYTLRDHLEQEVFVCQRSERQTEKNDFSEIQAFYQHHQQNDDYSLIFNFFYGDDASESLGFSTYGIKAVNGFDYAAHLAVR